MKTVILSKAECNRMIAEKIADTVSAKNDCTLAYMADTDFDGVWESLSEMNCDLSHIKLFLMAELEKEKRFENILTAQLTKVNINPENVVIISSENYVNLDESITAAGGIDLALTNIGTNGRFGFNEPGTQYDTYSHRQKLTKATLKDLGMAEDSEVFGVTMGIKTVINSKNIIVAAYGEKYAKSVFQMLYARDDSIVPAAFLQLPLNVTVYVDEQAGAKL